MDPAVTEAAPARQGVTRPADRLVRPFPGEHIGDERPGMTRRWERDRPLERPSPIPPRDTAELRSVAVRMTTRTIEPRPNAPLLIRLVRHPYALDLGRARKVAYRGDDLALLGRGAASARVDWHAEVLAALADRVRMRSTSGVESRPLPFTIRPSIWKLIPSEVRPRPQAEENARLTPGDRR